ncbi:guanine nucleotide exchange protein for ADP-robosylation factor [Coemansia sp. RSA 2711]|nr:guanine nucleotide exchange protein for ADP-robosylation factor [Coemansia sp. RSA 2711]
MAAVDLQPAGEGHLTEKASMETQSIQKTPTSTESISSSMLTTDPQRLLIHALRPYRGSAGKVTAPNGDTRNAPPAASDPPEPTQGLPGLVFVIGAIERLQATREGRRRELAASLERVQQMLRAKARGQPLARGEAEDVVMVLAQACGTRSSAVAVVALDCVEKLVSFRYLDQITGAEPSYYEEVGARLVRVATGCFSEGAGEAVQVQVVKALFALVSSARLGVRGAAMLEAVRTAFGVFTAAGLGTQTIVEGTLTQMVHLVLARVATESDSDDEAVGDARARDAFALVRALCKLVMRDGADPRAVRTRCLALALVRVALAEHTRVFTSAYVYLRAPGTHTETAAAAAAAPAATDEFGDVEGPDAAITELAGDVQADGAAVAVPLIAVVRQYLSLALSRSLTSPTAAVQDAGLAVLELAMRHVRMHLRREAEVLFGEIVIPLLETRNAASLHQRARMLQTLARLLTLPALVVELFLNHDCSEESHVNVFQRLAEVLCKLSGATVALPPRGSPQHALAADVDGAAEAAWRAVQQRQTVFNAPSEPDTQSPLQPPLTAGTEPRLSSATPTTLSGSDISDEYGIRQLALDGLSALLQSMVVWSDKLADPEIEAPVSPQTPQPEEAERAVSAEPRDAGDDPHELLSIKTRKAQLEAGCRQFAWKPRRGIDAWRAAGLLASNDPLEVARFLYAHRGSIDKVQLGEYLGEGDAHNVAVMHAFIDCMDFSGLGFVAALRLLLQAFRLPGEGQKIDRFMLKFAERFVMGNPDAGFANADAAYVLAYSTIMLNTDQHSPQVRHRMSRAEFISNNRGINDGQDLDRQMLETVFDQVAGEEIKLKDDPLQGRVQDARTSSGLFVLWGNSTANRIREQHAHASAEMAAKSEQSIRSMTQRRRRMSGAGEASWAVLLDTADYLRATRPDHIAPMFGAVWTAVLAALSTPMQTSADPHVVAACLVGFQSGIALACRFRMPLERATFVTTLRNFTQLQNLAEMRRKHVEAIRALVEVAASRADVGDGLADNWLDVLQCVSQLEQLQLLTQGSEQAALLRRTSTSTDAAAAQSNIFSSVLSVSAPTTGEQQSISARAFFGSPATTRRSSATLVPTVSVAELAKLETNSQVLVVTVDRLFTASVRLSGSGIVDFVRALSQVAWGEITTAFAAGQAVGSVPSRLFSLTKIVEIAYYNMERIRVEWSQIWAILGPLFDRVGGYADTRAAVFALDSLRQLSTKFLEKEELPHFAFQKEFLRPFADILEGAADLRVKDMALRCVYQLVQAASAHIRSGWRAVLNVAQIAARDTHDQVAEMGFHIARECAQHHGAHMWTLALVQIAGEDGKQASVVAVTGLEYFHELITCLDEFAVGAAAAARPRLALGAIDTMYRAAVALGAQVIGHAGFDACAAVVALDDQPLYRVWMPVLRALHAAVMHTEDLEVRTRALDAFFRLVMTQGRHFSPGLWAHVLRTLVFPMFADLRDPSVSRRFATVDDLELWFSTTLIKALRHVIAVYSAYYPEQLSNAMMTEVLELLVLCIAQPSEVLGKVGTSCLQDMVRSNYAKWDAEAWTLVCETLARLFNWSQPRELFTVAGAEYEGTPLPVLAPRVKSSEANASNRPSPLRTGDSAASLLSSAEATPSPSPMAPELPLSFALPHASGPLAGSDSKPDYVCITLKCMLQLLLIQTIGELFGVDVETGSALSSSVDLYAHMSAHHLFILLDCLDQSRTFAYRFNENRKVRKRLVEMGVMPTMPSLLRQETGSVLMELHILQRMHLDALGVSGKVVADRETVVEEVDDRLSLLVRSVTTQYLGYIEKEKRRLRAVSKANRLDPLSTEAKKRSVVTAAWRASVVAILEYVLELKAHSVFGVVVSRLWQDMVEIIGVAVDADDRDIVGKVQLILAAAGEHKLKLC